MSIPKIVVKDGKYEVQIGDEPFAVMTLSENGTEFKFLGDAANVLSGDSLCFADLKSLASPVLSGVGINADSILTKLTSVYTNLGLDLESIPSIMNRVIQRLSQITRMPSEDELVKEIEIQISVGNVMNRFSISETERHLLENIISELHGTINFSSEEFYKLVYDKYNLATVSID